jgi:hypothetical protein
LTCLLLFFRVSDSLPWNAGDEDDGEIRALPDGFEGLVVDCGMELNNFPYGLLWVRRTGVVLFDWN